MTVRLYSTFRQKIKNCGGQPRPTRHIWFQRTRPQLSWSFAAVFVRITKCCKSVSFTVPPHCLRQIDRPVHRTTELVANGGCPPIVDMASVFIHTPPLYPHSIAEWVRTSACVALHISTNAPLLLFHQELSYKVSILCISALDIFFIHNALVNCVSNLYSTWLNGEKRGRVLFCLWEHARKTIPTLDANSTLDFSAYDWSV